MTTAESSATRRALLRTIAAAVAGTAVTTGAAVASDFEDGDCAVTRGDTEVYDSACPAEDRIGVIEGGTEGEIGCCSCVDEFGTEWVYFAPYTDLSLAGWVREGSLEHC